MTIDNYTDRERKLHREIDRLRTEAVAADIRIANDALVIAGLTAERDALQSKITVLEGHAHAGLLEAFDAYARQFTYNSHPAKPEHFPKSFLWFTAGYAAAGAAPVLLTDEQIDDLADKYTGNYPTGGLNYSKFARAIEAAHGIIPKEPT